MHYLIRSFFYAIALLTLYWMTQTSPESVTFEAWVHAAHTLKAQQIVAIVTLFVAYADDAIWALLAIPEMVAKVVTSRRLKRPYP